MILCVYYMTGTPEGSTESGFMEKLGFEPATPGLQGIALIHYTTGASLTQVTSTHQLLNHQSDNTYFCLETQKIK